MARARQHCREVSKMPFEYEDAKKATISIAAYRKDRDEFGNADRLHKCMV